MTRNTTTATARNAQEGTAPTMNEIELAQDAARRAQDYARELQRQADTAEADSKAHREAAVIAYYRTTDPNDARRHNERIKEARAAFEESVISGGNYHRAWIEYKAAIAAAVTKESIGTTKLYEHDLAKYEALGAQVNEWNNEFASLNITKQAGTPIAGSYRQRGWWGAHVPGLPPATIEKLKRANTRIEQLNMEINATTEALGAPLKRELGKTAPVMILDIQDKPRSPRLTTGSTSRYEQRTLQQAVNEILDEQLRMAMDEVNRQHREEREQFIKNYQG